MTILRIYGDEAGTMPLEDDGDIFVTATVSVLGEPPLINLPNGHHTWLIDQFKALNVTPCIAFIKPISGYGKEIKIKLDKMNIMARMTRLITGSNAQYLTQEGIPLRNYIWVFCMGQAIGQGIVGAIVKEYNVDRIEIVLDQKTMPVPVRSLFKNQIQQISPLLGEILEQAKQINPQLAEKFKSRLRFSQDTISLCWSDEVNSSSSKGGLVLAHYLASHYRKGLIKPNNPIKLRLSQSGFQNIDVDFTNKITSIDRRAIENWEAITGLREPNIGSINL